MLCVNIKVEGMTVLLQLCKDKSENNNQYAESDRAERWKEIKSLMMLLSFRINLSIITTPQEFFIM